MKTWAIGQQKPIPAGMLQVRFSSKPLPQLMEGSCMWFLMSAEDGFYFCRHLLLTGNELCNPSICRGKEHFLFCLFFLEEHVDLYRQTVFFKVSCKIFSSLKFWNHWLQTLPVISSSMSALSSCPTFEKERLALGTSQGLSVERFLKGTKYWPTALIWPNFQCKILLWIGCCCF